MNKDYARKPATYYQGINHQLFSIIEPSVKQVLDVGCSEGLLGAAIKDAYSATVHGFEQFPTAVAAARKKLDSVTVGDIETDPLPFEQEAFDAIIFADVLEHMVDPWAVLEKVKPYLTSQGSVYASIPNVGHISIIEELLNGTWNYVDAGLLDKTHLRFFTKNGIKQLFTASGYSIELVVNNQSAHPHQLELIHQLMNISTQLGINTTDLNERTLAYQYMLKAKPVK
ncbi:class I SAM-dependent methyltransferase [Bacillus sp. JCM 19041]|uniref:class I SAM-dependent methyltransferase n=1 Tax=Bacillus sp. JCM 19041 TaxID=1460637 RepID=UPI0006D1D7BC